MGPENSGAAGEGVSGGNQPASHGSDRADEAGRQIDGSAGDLLAEHATVGALLLAAPSVQREILGIATAADFSDLRCRLIVDTANEMLAAGDPLDPVTLLGHVNREAKLAAGLPRAGLFSFVHELTRGVPVPVSGPWYASQVVERAARQKVWFAGERLLSVAGAAQLSQLRQVLTETFVAAIEAVNRAERAVIG